jgi:hypothetical protein
MFGGFIQKQERKVVAGQLDELAEELRTGRWKTMSPKVMHYLEAALWAAGAAAIPVIQADLAQGTLTKSTWIAAAASALGGLAAYLRKNALVVPDEKGTGS